MGNRKMIKPTDDAIINNVIDRILQRHSQGMEKFKQTMDENPKTVDDWTEDIIEELIDAICYLVVRKKRLKEINYIGQIEEVKKEADTLMIDKIQKHHKEVEHLKKEMALVREQAQIDILIKDQELGRAYKKINELSNGTKKT